MKIATYLDVEGVPVSLYQPGTLDVYEETGDGEIRRWQRCARLPFQFDPQMSLKQLRTSIAEMVAALDQDCRVLLSGDVRGLPYVVLQELHDFHIWKSEGELTQQLTYVRDRETETAAQRKCAMATPASQPVPAPVPVSDGEPGHYWIDLRAALAHASRPTSRNILIPFLNAGLFVKLDVLCGHIPEWMPREIERLDLAAESEPIDATDDSLRVSVYSRKAPEGRNRPPGLAGASQALSLTCPRERRHMVAPPAPETVE